MLQLCKHLFPERYSAPYGWRAWNRFNRVQKSSPDSSSPGDPAPASPPASLATAAAPCSASRNACLPSPMPCSPVDVPPIAIARAVRRSLIASAASISACDAGSTLIPRWKVAVADVADQDDRQTGPPQSASVSAMQSASREIGTHTSVDTTRVLGRKAERTRSSVVARRPQARALLGRRRPLEAHPAMLVGDRLHDRRLLLDARRRAVELEEQHRRFRQPDLAVQVDRADRRGVEQLAARDRHAELDRLDHRLDRVAHRSGTGRSPPRSLPAAGAPHGHLGDDPERALRADEQPREVVARGRLPRARAGADHACRPPARPSARARSRASSRSAPRSCPTRASRPSRRASRPRRDRAGRRGRCRAARR